MAQVTLRNISGTDREVPLPSGGYVIVPARASHEFEADHARSLREQPDVWAPVNTEKQRKAANAAARATRPENDPEAEAAAEQTPADVTNPGVAIDEGSE